MSLDDLFDESDVTFIRSEVAPHQFEKHYVLSEEDKQTVLALIADRNSWKEAWWKQRKATGNMYWDGLQYGIECGQKMKAKEE